MEDNRLGGWLEDRCEAEHLSLREAAAQTGLSHSTIRDVVKGVSPQLETIWKLAEGFGGGNALLDHLLLLAGYRKASPGEPSGPLAELIDRLGEFDDRQIELVTHFADFLQEAVPRVGEVE